MGLFQQKLDSHRRGRYTPGERDRGGEEFSLLCLAARLSLSMTKMNIPYFWRGGGGGGGGESLGMRLHVGYSGTMVD